MSVPRISNNSFWGFGSASVSRFTNFLDFNFNCDGYYYYDEALSARAKIKNQKVRGVLPFVFNFIRTAGKERF